MSTVASHLPAAPRVRGVGADGRGDGPVTDAITIAGPKARSSGGLPVGSAGSSIALFSGALGLDLGLAAGGLELRAAVEVNRWAVQTIRANTDVRVIDDAIEKVPTSRILEVAGLSPGDVTLVSGGPSCRSFSTAGHRRSLGVEQGWLFKEFLRVVAQSRPRFFVMEQVRGVLSAAVKHRPLAERGPGHPTLESEEQHGSAFRLILEEFRALGYYVVFGMVDAADYGVAQHRQRLIFIGSRDGENVRLPPATHAPIARPGMEGHRTLREALDGLVDPRPQVRPLPPEWKPLLSKVPAGGNWRDLPAELQRVALGRAYDSWGGRSGFFRRLSWEQPTPALTTNPAAKATMLLHPDGKRVLSVREYARLQGFPDDWQFAGGCQAQYTQIGNAVPFEIGAAVGRVLAALIAAPTAADAARLGRVACEDRQLIDRFNARPRTVLNPQRMRSDQTLGAARAWMGNLGGSTRDPIEVEILPRI